MGALAQTKPGASTKKRPELFGSDLNRLRLTEAPPSRPRPRTARRVLLRQPGVQYSSHQNTDRGLNQLYKKRIADCVESHLKFAEDCTRRGHKAGWADPEAQRKHDLE